MSTKGTDRISELMRSHPAKVLPCSCTAAGTIWVKSGVVQKRKPECPSIPPERFPFHTRGAGAEFQDRKYGKGMRLHNPRFGGKPKKFDGYTCTVCGTQKGV